MSLLLLAIAACAADPAPVPAPVSGLALEQVSARLPAPPATGEPALQVTARRATWDLAARSVRFEGEVRGTRADVSLTCERLDVWFTDPDRLDRAEASGGVDVRQGARHGRAERARLDVPTGVIELSGSPWIQEGGRRMAGSRIVLHLDEDRVECESCVLDVAVPEAPR